MLLLKNCINIVKCGFISTPTNTVKKMFPDPKSDFWRNASGLSFDFYRTTEGGLTNCDSSLLDTEKDICSSPLLQNHTSGSSSHFHGFLK